jgi:hypothetical protein
MLAMKCDLFVSVKFTFINLYFLMIKYLYELCKYEIIYFVNVATSFLTVYVPVGVRYV